MTLDGNVLKQKLRPIFYILGTFLASAFTVNSPKVFIYNQSVRKYWLFLKTQISLITTYRFDLVWRWVSNLFEVIVYFSLWSLTTNGDVTQIRRLLIYYVLFYGFLHNIQTSRGANWMGDDIHSGALNHFLTKPINFPLTTIIRTVAMIISRVVVTVFLITMGVILFPSYLAPSSVISFVLFATFALLGLILWNLLMVVIGSLAFWLTEIKSLVTLVDLILSLIKGAFVPVYLFPEQLQRALSWTPFNYLSAFPIDIYQGLVAPKVILTGLIIICFWILALGLLCRFTYSRGIARYEAVG